jgi:hypothetical protein
MRLIGLIWIGAMVTFAAGCGQSPAPPAVAEVPAVAEAPDPTKHEPAPTTKADSAPLPDGGTFPFPDDAEGKALAKTLAPAPLPPIPPAGPVMPRERKLPAFLDAPAPAPPGTASIAPRLSLPAGKEVLPAPLPERVPRDLGGSLPQLPARDELPTGPLIRQPGPDISKPADLPILSSRPVTDRAPLTDPTLEFTARSVISLNLPLRSTPLGFLRIALPDPFEHADAARARTPVVENPNRSLGSPPAPRQ